MDTRGKKSGFQNPFTSLRHQSFRYYWLGMCVSTIGTWMQNTAQPWLAYKLTDSPFLLSLTGALQFTPVLLFSLVAGVLVDKFPKKKILLFTQSMFLLITMVLTVLVMTGSIRYWHILITATAMGFINTLDIPTRQSFIIEMVGKDDLTNAIALNSMVFNLARIVGPAAAGIVMGTLSIGACFLANSISFGAVVISLFFIKPRNEMKAPQVGGDMLSKIKEGVRYIAHRKILLVPLVIMAIVGTFAPNFSVLVPVFSEKVLGQQETGFGFLMSFIGVGSFLGAMLAATRSRSGPNMQIIRIVPVLLGILLIIVGITHTFFLAAFFLTILGFLFVQYSTSTNSTMQLNAENEYLGRVMSVYSLVFAGSTPFGNLFAGSITDHFGPKIGFMACGAVVILLMIPVYAFLMRERKKAPRVEESKPLPRSSEPLFGHNKPYR